ncbi:MAG: hypothetical protein J5637_09220 [Prevotella sp.]|nr:hypothetical protein [Prevotella sp.]
MEKEMLYKSRSFSSCILAAYQLMSKNLWSILKATWLPVLLNVLFLAFLMTINLPNEEVVALGAAHFALYIGVLAVCLLGFIVTDIWATSRLMSILNEEPRRWNFVRMVWLTLNSIVITLAIGVVVVALAKLAGGWLAPYLQSHIWAFLALSFFILVLACVLLLPLNYVFMKYLNERGMCFWRDFLSSYRIGLRRVSFIFITLFITVLIVMILACIVMLPYLTLTSAYYTSLMGHLLGDPSDLPSYFPVLYFITTAAVYFLIWYVGAFIVVVMFFMYGSIEKRLEEQHAEQFEAQLASFADTELTDIPPIRLQ